MFMIPSSALEYEKYMRLLEADEQMQDPNAAPEQAADPQQMQQDPNAQQAMPQEDGGDPSQMQPQDSGLNQAQTPEEAYESGLAEIQNVIAMTGRKRYQRYKLNGGRDSWEIFKKNLEDTLTQELQNDCKEMFGYNPATTTEKDILLMIKNGIDQLNQAMQAGMQADMQQQDPNAQQAMQEAYNYIADRYYNQYF